jgi:hypothetical protein
MPAVWERGTFQGESGHFRNDMPQSLQVVQRLSAAGKQILQGKSAAARAPNPEPEPRTQNLELNPETEHEPRSEKGEV